MKKGMTAVLAILVILLAGSTYYFFDSFTKTNKELKTLKKDPQANAKKEADEVTAQVGKLMNLPKDEKATIATIADKSKIDIKQQPFFTNAANGDKVLLYVKAKKAILFRVSTNKIIEVGTLNVQQQDKGTQVQPTQKPQAVATTAPTKAPTAKP